jgi:hypothetical protein
MDNQPKTRRESKKSAKEKAEGKDTCYSAKRIRQLEALQASSGKSTKHTPTHK